MLSCLIPYVKRLRKLSPIYLLLSSASKFVLICFLLNSIFFEINTRPLQTLYWPPFLELKDTNIIYGGPPLALLKFKLMVLRKWDFRLHACTITFKSAEFKSTFNFESLMVFFIRKNNNLYNSSSWVIVAGLSNEYYRW